MDLSKALNFKDSQEWRQWLQQNHDVENSALLFIYKKRSGKNGISYDRALEEALYPVDPMNLIPENI